MSAHPTRQRPPRQPLVEPGGIDHHVQDMAVTVSADVTLAALQTRLAERGQWLPVDGDASAALGRLLLAHSTGPLRLGYGGWRDLLLGVQFLNGQDELITAGGRVVKNVAGYDLAKFIAASHGVFGTPVTLTTRTYRRPALALRVIIRPRPPVARFAALMTTPMRPHWAVLSLDALTLGYHGDEPAIDYFSVQTARLQPARTERGDLSADEQARAALWPAHAGWRASVPPATLDRFLDRIAPHPFAADPAFGIVVGPTEPAIDVARLRCAADEVGGSCMVFGPDGRPADIAGDAPTYELLTRLKDAFDPHHRLPPLPARRP